MWAGIACYSPMRYGRSSRRRSVSASKLCPEIGFSFFIVFHAGAKFREREKSYFECNTSESGKFFRLELSKVKRTHCFRDGDFPLKCGRDGCRNWRLDPESRGELRGDWRGRSTLDNLPDGRLGSSGLAPRAKSSPRRYSGERRKTARRQVANAGEALERQRVSSQRDADARHLCEAAG